MGQKTGYRAPLIQSLEKRLMLDASLPVVAGHVFWLDAADASTILDGDGDAADTGTGGANNGFSGSVATWRDKSGSGFHVVNGTATQQPTYTLGALNGGNVVTFDGATDRLVNAAASIAGNDHTIFIVFNRTTATGRDAVFELGGGASRNALFMNEGSTNRINYYVNSAFYNSSGTYTTGAYELVSITHDNNAFSLHRGNNQQLNQTGGIRATTTGIVIGDDSTSGDQLQGNIAEMIVYDRDLTAAERRDIENYLATKWGLGVTNVAPVLDLNTGATLDQGTVITITSMHLSASDADNTDARLIYTVSDLSDYGTLTNSNTLHVYTLGESFTQADINNGYIVYTHNGTANFADAFSFTVSDRYAVTAAATFSLTVNPVNEAPQFQGWTPVSSENFETGASGWSNNTTTNGGVYLTRFLGRHSSDGGTQNVHKTYMMSGTQDHTILTFDFYRLDSWDAEEFRIFIDDVMVFNQAFSAGFSVIPDGSLGNVSWTVQEVTGGAPNFVFGQWGDQIMRFTMRIDNASAGTFKLGFSSTTNQGITDEAWGVDNINIYETSAGGSPGPFHVVEGMANGTLVGTLVATDPDVGDTLTYSVTGGTGAGIFSVNAATGAVTLINTAVVNYEATASYTLTVRVTDNGTPSAYDEKTITINVIDRPENTAPVINPIAAITIAENTALNTVIGTATGNDAEGHTITWSITGGNTDSIFAINATTGAIRIADIAGLNHEWDNSYTITIQAQDNGFANMTSTRNVTINIADVNEAPTFNIPQSFLDENPYLRYNSATGNFYRYIGTTASYAAANTAASAALLNGVAGHLVTIGSAPENAYVRALGAGALWLGGSDSVLEGEWVWGGNGAESGQIFSIGSVAQGSFYTNWAVGQPDNGSNSDFLEMATSGQWTDVNSGNRAYVIEWEGAAVLAALGNGPFTLAENPVVNQSVGFVHALDADAGDVLAYSITGGTGNGVFSINGSTGEIRVTNPSAINYESAASLTLDIRVQDAGGLFDTQTVIINITDVNEAPVMAAVAAVIIPENIALNTVIADFNATDVDAGQTLTYSITGGNALGIFAINASTGDVRIANRDNLNYETGNLYNLTIRVTDNGTPSLFAQRTLTVHISDVAEAPSFDPIQRLLNADPGLRYNPDTGNFYRYTPVVANLATATANANVALLNGVGGYLTAIGSAAENTFVRNMISATIWLGATDGPVEGEWRWMGGEHAGQMFWLGNASGSAQNSLYNSWSGGEPNNSGGNEDGVELRTNGTWNDTNVGGTRAYVIEWDGAAVLASLQNGPYVIGEHTPSGSPIGMATAGDPDIGDILTYSITGGSGAGIFSINALTGQIALVSGVNYEAQSSYTLDLQVVDSTGLFDTTTVMVTVTDQNDIPAILDLSGTHIVENSAIGTLIGTLSTVDEDPTDTHVYTLLTNPAAKFEIVNGNELRTLDEIDYELSQSFSVVIRTDDGNGGILDRTFIITVGDVMDTFTPPPATGGVGGNDVYIPSHNEKEGPSASLLRSSLGGEQGAFGAFYGDFHQILRENVTFEIMNLLSRSGSYPDNAETTDGSLLAGILPEPETDGGSMAHGGSSQGPDYTNLREALGFLQQLANRQTVTEAQGMEAERGGGGTGASRDDRQDRGLPANTIDRQFVDVMTYHQERAARLREALS